MKIKNNFIFWQVVFLVIICAHLSYAGGIRLGQDLRIRYATEKDSDGYWDHRMRSFLEGTLDQKVSVYFRINSSGRWDLPYGEYASIDGYTYTNNSLWVENAFIEMCSFQNMPADILIGRQPIKWGTGVLLNDDNNGFNAIRAISFLPYNINVEMLTVQDNPVLSGMALWWIKNRWHFQLSGLIENRRNFVDFFFSRNMYRGLGIQGEAFYTIYQGKTNISFLIQSEVETAIKMVGGVRAVFGYLYGMKGNDYAPTRGRLSESDWGEIYWLVQDSHKYSYSLTDMNTLKLGLKYRPASKTTLGFNFFHYTHRITIPKPMADETDLFFQYDYSQNTSFRLCYAMLSPVADTYKGDPIAGSNRWKLRADLSVSY